MTRKRDNAAQTGGRPSDRAAARETTAMPTAPDRSPIRLPWRSLVLAALAVGLFLWLGPAPGSLVLDRAAVSRGEAWRLACGHLVHGDGAHLAWDTAGLLVLGALFEARLGRLFFPVLAGGAVAIDAWFVFASGLARYCGLSGLCNSLLAAGLAATWRESRGPAAPATALLAVAKILVEASRHAALFTTTAWSPAPLAHAVGFAAGLGLWCALSGLPARRPALAVSRKTFYQPRNRRSAFPAS